MKPLFLRRLTGLFLFATLAPHSVAQSYIFTKVESPAYAPRAIAAAAGGATFVSASSSHAIYKLASDGAVLAQYGSGDYSAPGLTDAVGRAARFRTPRGLAIDVSGNVYVADTGNHAIRRIAADGTVSTLAGADATEGAIDGPASAARLRAPEGIAIDSAGRVYVADTGNHAIRRISPSGRVDTFAGTIGQSGKADGPGSMAGFNSPQGLAIDASGNLFVADTGNCTIRKITPAGTVSTVVGLAGSRGFVDDTGAFARLSGPQAICVDSAGNLFVADSGNSVVRRVSPNAALITLSRLGVYLPGGTFGTPAELVGPRAIAIDASGQLLAADDFGLKRGTVADAPAITLLSGPTSFAGLGASVRLRATVLGRAPITYTWLKDDVPIAGATTAVLDLGPIRSEDAGNYALKATNPAGATTSPQRSLQVVAAVPNDNFASATRLFGDSGTFTGTTLGATGEDGEPTHGEPTTAQTSVWYRWTAPRDGTLAISSEYPQTFLSGFWIGESVSSLSAPTRAFAGGSARAPVFKDTTYHIAVGSWIGRGRFEMTWRIIPNDDFALAQVLPGDSGFGSASNFYATREPGEPAEIGSPNSLWYRWTPTRDGVATFGTSGDGFPMSFTAFAGDALANLRPVPQSYDSRPNFGRRAFVARAGSTYHLAVAGYGSWQQVSLGNFREVNFGYRWSLTSLPVISGAATGTILPITAENRPATSLFTRAGSTVRFSIDHVSDTPATVQWHRNGLPINGATAATYTLVDAQPTDAGAYAAVVVNRAGSDTSDNVKLEVYIPPPNDDLSDAVSLAGAAGTVAGTTRNASREPAEARSAGLDGYTVGVWYRWIAPISGFATFDTIGSGSDTVLAVYTGSDFSDFVLVAQNDDRSSGAVSSLVSFAATAGTSYFVTVGIGGNGSGAIRLNWQTAPGLALAAAPANQIAAVGSSITLTAAANDPAATYQWNRNGTPIPGATRATLSLGNLQAGADASYTVTVANAVGSVTSEPATLAIASPIPVSFSVRHRQSGGSLLWSIAANDAVLVAVGDAGIILASTDGGRSWSPRVSGTSRWLVGVAYGAGQFVAVGDSGIVLRSPDGSTWTPAAAAGTNRRLNNVLYAAGQFVAVGEGGTILTSTDGDSWTPRVSGTTGWLRGLAYHSGLGHFAASGQAGVFLRSADAATWERLPIPGLTTDLEATVAVDGYAHFVSIGQDGRAAGVRRTETVLKSGEAVVRWSAELRSTGSSVRFRGLAQGAEALFATGEDGKIVTAAGDAGPWFTLPVATSANLVSGIYHRDTLFIVGAGETILQSDALYTGRLTNVSTRAQAGSGTAALIGGFVLNGDRPKQVLLRAIGPGLTTFRVGTPLGNPVLDLFDGNQRNLGRNAGWTNAPNREKLILATDRVGAFPLSFNNADSAILTTLPPGAYTAQISGQGNASGQALLEIYDADPFANDGPRTVNISSRGMVGPSGFAAGFVIGGASARRVLIRAAGPALAQFGVPDYLPDPELTLFNARSFRHTGRAGAWDLQANADEIRAAVRAVGAFPFSNGTLDSALLVTLLPGAWTVHVNGARTISGTVLVEVYELP